MSFTISAASRDDTGTIRDVSRRKRAAAASRLGPSSPPTIWGSSSSSRSACPWIVRSGQKASRARPQRATSSGSTTARLAPTGTVDRTTTSVSESNAAATARAASRRGSSTGSRVTGSTGVETQSTAPSTGSRGSSGMAPDVEPVLADRVRRHVLAPREKEPDQLRGVEVLSTREHVHDRRLEHVDAGVDRKFLPRLLVDALDALAPERELPVRDLDLVERDAHRHRRTHPGPVEIGRASCRERAQNAERA